MTDEEVSEKLKVELIGLMESSITHCGGFVFSAKACENMAPSRTYIISDELAGFGNGFFNGFFIQVNHKEMQRIYEYRSVGIFSTHAFSEDVKAGDDIRIIHEKGIEMENKIREQAKEMIQ